MKSVVGTLHPILHRSHPTIPLSICCYVDSTAQYTARFGTNFSSRSSRWESRRYRRRVIRRGKRRRKMVKKTERAKQKAAVDIVVNRGAWTAEEDQKLVDYVRDHGDKNWRTLPAKAGLNRCGKSCRLRWLNYLRPGIKRGNISDEEEDLIIRLHNLLGNRWSLIAGRLPGRTDNEIKNHWNTHLSRRPVTIDDLNLKLNQQVERTCERGPLVSPVESSRDLTTPVDHVEDEWVLDGTAELLQHSELDMDQLFALMPDPDGGASNGSEFGAEADGSGGEEGYRDINEGEISGAKTEGCSDAQAGWDASAFDVDLERFMGYDDDLAFYFLD